MKTTRSLLVVKCAIAVAASAIAGCHSGGRDVAVVRGSVHYDGKPLKKGLVMFQPSNGRLGKGAIEPDGSFEISTYGVGDGALVGPSRIAVVCVEIDGDERRTLATKRWLIPEVFGNVGTSRLQCEVGDVPANVFKIILNTDGTGTVAREEE